MSAISPPTPPSPQPTKPDAGFEELVRYYSEAGPDYGAWSNAFNMHFGYFRGGMNPFRLEPMLERMNREVLDRLALGPEEPARLLDLGCGLGATARVAARRFPNAAVTGVTVVPWQIEQARRLTQDQGLTERVAFVNADYTASPFPSQSFDGAYALESACYAAGRDKAPFLREAHRLLKPGRRLLIADGFLKDEKPLNPILRRCYRKVCDCWSLDTFAVLPLFLARMEHLGFRDIQVEEISWNIAPSVLHVPWVTFRFLCRQVFSKTKMTRKRWDNVIAPMLGIAVGLARRRYGYFLISASR